MVVFLHVLQVVTAEVPMVRTTACNITEMEIGMKYLAAAPFESRPPEIPSQDLTLGPLKLGPALDLESIETLRLALELPPRGWLWLRSN